MSERVPTVFTFYGYMSNGKRGGRGYTTRANSLNDALDDLERVEGDVENGYLVSDAFVVLAEGEPHKRRKTPRMRKPRDSRAFNQSGRRDSNSGPLVPQTSALTRLRHAPRRCAR
jgi:hypothetical protein